MSSVSRKKRPHSYRAHERVEHDFLDPSRKWRRIFSEWWGTFLLVIVAAGGHVVAAQSNGKVTLDMIVVAPGLMVMVSGAHLNPAVTLAFALRPVASRPWLCFFSVGRCCRSSIIFARDLR